MVCPKTGKKCSGCHWHSVLGLAPDWPSFGPPNREPLRTGPSTRYARTTQTRAEKAGMGMSQEREMGVFLCPRIAVHHAVWPCGSFAPWCYPRQPLFLKRSNKKTKIERLMFPSLTRNKPDVPQYKSHQHPTSSPPRK